MTDSDSTSMRAIVHPAYGAADVLRVEEIERPTIGAGDVLVRVRAAVVTKGDHHVLTGTPYLIRLMGYGLRRPANPVPGMGMAGRVVAVGADVTDLAPGDEVFGELRTGAFAEYAAAPSELLAKKPADASFEDAAAVSCAGTTALQALRDVACVRSGQRVLINGASGGVGSLAVQIAKSLGAQVTAVCSTRNIDCVLALGADRAIDYTCEDFAGTEPAHDAMLDLVGNRSLSDCKRALTRHGVYVACSGQVGGDWLGPVLWLAAVNLASVFSTQRLVTFVAQPNRADLEDVAELMRRGALAPLVDHRPSLAAVPEALRLLATGHTRGQVVVSV